MNFILFESLQANNFEKFTFAKKFVASAEHSGQGKNLHILTKWLNIWGDNLVYTLSSIVIVNRWNKFHIAGPQICGGDIDIFKLYKKYKDKT